MQMSARRIERYERIAVTKDTPEAGLPTRARSHDGKSSGRSFARDSLHVPLPTAARVEFLSEATQGSQLRLGSFQILFGERHPWSLIIEEEACYPEAASSMHDLD